MSLERTDSGKYLKCDRIDWRQIIYSLPKCVFCSLASINYPTFKLHRSIIIHHQDPSVSSKCFVQFSGRFCSWRFSILWHGYPFLQSVSEHFSTVLHRGEAIPRRTERDGKGEFQPLQMRMCIYSFKKVNL